MLVITRRVGEMFVSAVPMVDADGQPVKNDDGTPRLVLVETTMLGVKGNQVRIGVNAPKDVQVHREEIWARIQAGVPMKAKAPKQEGAGA